MTTAADDRFEIERRRDDAGEILLDVSGAIALDQTSHLLRRLDEIVTGEDRASVTVSLERADHADASVVLALVSWCGAAERRRLRVGDDLRALTELLEKSALGEVPTPRMPGSLERIGRAVAGLGVEGKAALGFLGELLVTAGRAVRHPLTIRWRDVGPLVERVGADGLFIVCLMNGLVGLVTGYQGAVQLQRFGADAYMANLVGLANVRELAPLMTAIIVTGRSGAGFAAELGTMKVSEEVDALRTLGFAPHGFLVVPRCLALLIAVPVLTLIADVAAILGALAIALLMLDTTATAFLIQTREAVSLSDVGSGILKSLAYAVAIGTTACHLGLRASGGARGVGERTTSTVVVVLVQLVVIDAVLTVLMHQLGLW